MLPTFVIGLREGLEAALIVGIIAAFLRKQGRRDLLRAVLAGVATAVLLCLAAGVALEVYSRELPQRQQEGLETVVGALAVLMVTYMVIWMRRHSRELKGQLEQLAAQAIDGGSRAGRAMVLMAFLAVIREGLETVVFLLAAFNESGSGPAAGAGAVLGIAVAVVLGYGIYRGGVRLNLSRFFRATGLVLVLVAAGLVVNALHTAHEAGWLDAGQGSTVDLSRLVSPGSVQASLLTGMLGIQAHPVTIELVGWLCYLLPVGLYVAWPPGRSLPTRAAARVAAVTGALAAVAAVGCTLGMPGPPAGHPVTAADGRSAVVISRSEGAAVLRLTDEHPIAGTTGAARNLRLGSDGIAGHRGVPAERFHGTLTGPGDAGRPSSVTAARLAALNGGRLPIGVATTGGTIALTYRDTRTVTAWLDTRTDRVLDLQWTESVTATAHDAGRVVPLARPIAHAATGLPAAAAARAVAAARAAHDRLDERRVLGTLAGVSAGLAALLLLAAVGLARMRGRSAPARAHPARSLVRS